MDGNSFVPLPIHFNCWKHHAGFIKERIKAIHSEKDMGTLRSSLLKIGESQMDLYLGKFSPEEISNQSIAMLKREKILSLEHYKKWLSKDGKDYQLISLKDKSIWTLRLSENQKRYIHLHPGRYSPHTIRVKATTLKTAILVLCLEQVGEIKSFETETVNNVRKKYLDEPPLKSLSKASGLIRLIDLLYKKL
jgi:hypothetical protein